MINILNFLFGVKGKIKPSTYLKFLFFLVCTWMLSFVLFRSYSTVYSILYIFMILSYLAFTLRFLSGRNQSSWLIVLYIAMPFLPFIIATFAYFESEYIKNTSLNKNMLLDRPVSITLIAYLFFSSAEIQLLELIIKLSLILFIQSILPVIAGIGLLNRMNWARIVALLFLLQQIFMSIYAGYPLKYQQIQAAIIMIILFFLFEKNSNLYFTKK